MQINGNGGPRGFTFFDFALKVGPAFGGLTGLCYAAAYVILFVKDRDLSDIAQVFFGVGFASAAWGLGHAAKKATDIIVQSEAEKRIADPGLTPGPVPSSTVPQIQRAIDTMQRDSHS